MSTGTYPLKLSHTLKKEAARLAKEDGISLNQWIGYAVAQKVGAAQTAADFFRELTKGASVEDLKRGLARVSDGPAMPGDEIDED
jgi:hypothetical protein